MSNFENTNEQEDNINEMVDDVKEYINLRIQLIQLNITEKISIALANLITSGAAIIFMVLFFIFGSFALSYMLGNVLHNTAAGFGVLAGFYLLIALLILWIGKGSLRKKMINYFINQFNNDEPETK